MPEAADPSAGHKSPDGRIAPDPEAEMLSWRQRMAAYRAVIMVRHGPGASEADLPVIASPCSARSRHAPPLVVDHGERHASGAHVYGACRHVVNTQGLLTGWPASTAVVSGARAGP